MRIRRKLLLGAAFVAVLGIAGPLMGQAVDDVVEGVEIDGNIRLEDVLSALLDWAVETDGDTTGCIVDDTDFGGACDGEPDHVHVIDQTTQGGNKDENVFDAGKEHLPAGWTFKKGDAPAKDDLGNVYAWKQEVTNVASPAFGDTIMYAAFERRVNNGDTHLDYELNQVTRLCPYSPGGGQPLGTIACPDRRAGDFILSFNLGPVTGGDFSDVVVELFQIVADGPDADTQGDLDLTPEFSILIDDATDIADLANGLDVSADIPNAICGGAACPAQTLVIGVNSGGSIDAGPWLSAQGNDAGVSTVDVANFFEAAINLNNIGRGPSCPGAASLTIKSRSSSSITSDLKDTIEPVPFDLTNCGSIVIIKNTTGGNGTFDYTTTEVPSEPDFPASFSITTVANTGTQSFLNNITPGQYTVTESTPPTGFSFKDLICVDGDLNGTASSPSSLSSASTTATLNVDANETVTCTYRNEQAQLTVNKSLVNACTTDTGTFNLLINGVTKATGVGNGGTTGAVIVPVGTNNFSEQGAGGTNLANYTKAVGGDAGCTEGTADDGAGSIVLAGGDSKTCTITNTRKATVTVQKALSPTSDSGRFDLVVNATEVKNEAGHGDSGSLSVAAGSSVTVSENAGETGGSGGGATNLASYQTFISCDNGQSATGTSVGPFNVQSGENVTCVITNVRVLAGDSCPAQ